MTGSWVNFLKFLRAAGLVVVASIALVTEAFSFDVHEMFEARCGRCHQHAGDLALKKLVIDNGVLRGRTSGNDIRAFLPNHFGYPNPEETTALYNMFVWQVEGGGRFKARCAICHIRARELARLNLVRDGDAVRGRYTGNDLSEFLSGHGRIDANEVDFFVRLLAQMAPTVDR